MTKLIIKVFLDVCIKLYFYLCDTFIYGQYVNKYINIYIKYGNKVYNLIIKHWTEKNIYVNVYIIIDVYIYTIYIWMNTYNLIIIIINYCFRYILHTLKILLF